MATRVVFTASLLALVATGSCVAQTLNVGSKRFTESYILGEIIKQAVNAAGEVKAEHRQGLGNTAIVLNALTTGAIDVYPEYTGTIAKEILKLDQVPPLPELNAKLAPMGLAAAVPLGFNNTYALALRGDDARARRLTTLSGLKAHRDLKLGLTQEFLGRADGWPGLKRAYELPFDTPRGLDHGIAYEAIEGRQIDVIDIYSTDAKLDKLGLVVLADDGGCAVARHGAGHDLAPDRASAGGADDPRRDQDLGCDQRRHRDDRGVHRRGRLWRAHRHRSCAQRSRVASGGCDPGSGARAPDRGRVPARRAVA
jgi:osmoprotectant transport system permease protein